jgi:hypothetical protein
MARKDNNDVLKAFHRLTEAAEEYVNRSPQVKRIQTQRSTLLDAISNAQLVLSVHRLPEESASERSKRASKESSTAALEKKLNDTRAAFHQLERRLRPVSSELEALHMRAQKAKNLLDRALAEQQEQDDAEESYE